MVNTLRAQGSATWNSLPEQLLPGQQASALHEMFSRVRSDRDTVSTSSPTWSDLKRSVCIVELLVNPVMRITGQKIQFFSKVGRTLWFVLWQQALLGLIRCVGRLSSRHVRMVGGISGNLQLFDRPQMGCKTASPSQYCCHRHSLLLQPFPAKCVSTLLFRHSSWLFSQSRLLRVGARAVCSGAWLRGQMCIER